MGMPLPTAAPENLAAAVGAGTPLPQLGVRCTWADGQGRVLSQVTNLPTMVIARSVLLFLLAALAEIGGAWLVWQGVREHRGLLWAGSGVVALGLYGFVATLQPDPSFGRILAAYGGVFVVGSLLWGMAAAGFKPDRYDVVGAAVCLVGVAVIMYAPRAAVLDG
jgi:small multidrug resistance family-3 protein